MNGHSHFSGVILPRLLRIAAVVLAAGAFVSFFFYGEIRDSFVDDTQYRQEIAAAAARHQLDPALVRAVIFRESRFDPFRKGSKGEFGLMQVLPSGSVADYCRVRKLPPIPESSLYAPSLNLEIGCWYLARARKRWQKYALCDALALCHYNAGERRAAKWCPKEPQDNDLNEFCKRIDISTTRAYVSYVLNRYRHYQQEEAAQRRLEAETARHLREIKHR